MKAAAHALLRILFSSSPFNFTGSLNSLSLSPLIKPIHHLSYSAIPRRSSSNIATASISLPFFSSETQISSEHAQKLAESNCNTDSSVVFQKWGFSESEISMIFCRCPSLRRANLSLLDSKLSLLKGLGLTSSDLVKIIHCRPRFLGTRINKFFDERLMYLESFFGSREVLIKAIVRNPSFLNYDFHQTIKPVLLMYEQLGITRKDLISMLLTRPTVITRSKLCQEKLDYIDKIGVTKESKLYKYVVTVLAVSRLETIKEKLAHFVTIGLSEEEVLKLVGRSPYLLTLSIDKVQRNMSFVIGMLKMNAKVVLYHPFLLYSNLEMVLKPRLALAGKIEEMDLRPRIKGPGILTAFRMKEKRFLEAFIKCHPDDIKDQLLEYYVNAKGIRPVSPVSKKISHKGFPF